MATIPTLDPRFTYKDQNGKVVNAITVDTPPGFEHNVIVNALNTLLKLWTSDDGAVTIWTMASSAAVT
ncbi:hypothetical protein JQ633_21665 [Bradyrhizobium tropiciagri]|uniref:hypothetical protein n=1 Tax=Bradyrhizobium tropiciagri TaxID=312253 RepID=UPI001BAD012A|nr:hypothetical protein [Bradyrhizobium tropiciagri]MBR0872979.1 hypothetical protein [Bradyrhizobium tropiciagri]